MKGVSEMSFENERDIHHVNNDNNYEGLWSHKRIILIRKQYLYE